MADINTALEASKDAMEQLILAGERTGITWTSPRAPGKWSPSQIVEHVARSLDESANMAAGRPSKFPKLPGIVHPIIRGILFKRVLRKAAFPKAKTNKAMDPASGPATPGEGRVRLETAHQKFDEACRQTASHGERMRTTVFGTVPVVKFAVSVTGGLPVCVALPVHWPVKSYGAVCASAATVPASSAMPSAATLVPEPEPDVRIQPSPSPPKSSCAGPYSPNTAFSASPSTKRPPASLL